MERTGHYTPKVWEDVIPQKRWPYGPRRDWEAPWAATTSEARTAHEQAL
jgi:hypothetical protein